MTAPELDDLELAIETVCRLPIDYEEFGDRSAVELVRRSGIRERLAELSVDRILTFLERNPDWVDAWFRWSEGTRGTPAWYVRPDSTTGQFDVGRVNRGGSLGDQQRFDDRIQACAVFVDREIRDMTRLL